MEDDLKEEKNRRQPQKNKMEDNLKKNQIIFFFENKNDDLKTMEDNLQKKNGRRPKKNGRRPKICFQKLKTI